MTIWAKNVKTSSKWEYHAQSRKILFEKFDYSS